MPKVILKGHDYVFPVSDLVTLFTGQPVRTEDNVIVSGEDTESVIYSVLTNTSIATYIVGGPSIETQIILLELPLKREIKRQLYFVLSRLYHREFPWGSLTGIRPTIVASEERSLSNLTEKYFVRPDKAELALSVAMEEEKILADTSIDSTSVYVGIPFCPSRCSYCSFIAYDAVSRRNRLDAYADAVLSEVRQFFEVSKHKPVYLYVGGGTPTVFEEEMFSSFFEKLFELIPRSSLREITVEAGRADTISHKKLQILKALGVNRICINPQTTSDETLLRLGRRHTSGDFYRAYEMAERLGFKTINTDIIAGLPGEDANDFSRTLSDILRLEPENITVHTLSKKRNADLEPDFPSFQGVLHDPLDTMLHEAHQRLMEESYIPYYLYRQKNTIGGHENTGFTKNGHACGYNVAMMSDQRYIIAFGAGSISKRHVNGTKLERCPNLKNPDEYIRRIAEMARKKTDFFCE